MKNYKITIFLIIIGLTIGGCSNKPSDSTIKKAFESLVLKEENIKMKDFNTDTYESISKLWVNKYCDTMEYYCPALIFALWSHETLKSEKAIEAGKETLNILKQLKTDYLSFNIGPFGKGYIIKSFKVTNGQKQTDVRGVEIYTAEYEAKLTALSDIENYSLPNAPWVKLNLNNNTDLAEFIYKFKRHEPPFEPIEVLVLPKGGELVKTGKIKI